MEKEEKLENVLKMLKFLRMCGYQLYVAGSVPSLRAERDLDPDQPVGHHAHHLPPQVTFVWAFSENCALHSKPCQTWPTCLRAGERQGAEGDAPAAAQRPPGGVQAVHGPAAAAQQRGQAEEEIR